MPIAAITPALATIIAGGAKAGADVVGAAMASRGASKAAQAQTNAANYAADVQGRSNADQLAFMRQAAQNQYQSDEATRHANYDQYAADRRMQYALQQQRAQRINSAGAILGFGGNVGGSLPPLEMPAYVPSVNPYFDRPSVGQALMPRPPGQYQLYGQPSAGRLLAGR